jgi:hypothetical protein
MKFSFAHALFCLLSLSPAICSAKPYVYPHAPAALDTPSPSENNATNGYDASEHTLLAKRVPAPPVTLSKKPGWGDTWFGYVQEPAASPWTGATIRTMTKQAFESRACFHPEKFILAAIWEPGVGVWFGSTVQGAGHDTIKTKCPSLAPRLWRTLKNRRYARGVNPAGTALFHAEDAALFWYESQQQQVARQNPYSLGTAIYVYGFRFPNEAIGKREPCGGPDAKIEPSCIDVVYKDLELREV